MVDVSPWPLSASIGALGFTIGFVTYVHEGMSMLVCCFLLGSFSLIALTAVRWWGDVIVESTFLGNHTSLVVLNLKYGFWFFVLSEAFLFVSFFWAFFNSSIGELSQQGVGHWPPLGVKSICPWKVPALNTAVLVGSGLFVNWAHGAVKAHGLVSMDDSKGNNIKVFLGRSYTGGEYWRIHGLISLGITIILGIFFTWLQATEYYMASYTIADSVFGSAFFILTGFHGAHVIAGTLFLTVCWVRLYLYHFSYQHHHFGMYAATIYWHFVDLVWVFVYGIIYIWGH
uniref:Cytochrome c oxidase subunit 3 n=1 Tax=Corbicula japonica TaxID=141464 RepID=A0A8H2SDL5_9BIVA|nr:cytochrome c oxidase subunit III [Corbicula japonica]QWS05869.1 cytochrome c oxidase subunit III [Corbicula japonica]UIF91967.1 cytochrome c oxidase subunit III [Corbicula japonica]UXG18806.1 cytochrome c oxidase subunit III [Corbicula japonica]